MFFNLTKSAQLVRLQRFDDVIDDVIGDETRAKLSETHQQKFRIQKYKYGRYSTKKTHPFDANMENIKNKLT